MKRTHLSRSTGGFTLTEVLVSSALIVGIMGLMLTTVDQTRRTISNTTSRVAQFQSARIAFEAMTRNLSQATLSTYWDLDRLADPTANPVNYRRQSDLHFICGKASQPALLGGQAGGDSQPRDEAHFPGHAIFFQAPIGSTAEESRSTDGGREYRSLTNLMCAMGYYVKWSEDTNLPPFMGSGEQVVPKRYRYRLMEVQQPAELGMFYFDKNYTILDGFGMTAKKGQGYPLPTDWIKVAVGAASFPSEFVTRIRSKTGKNFDPTLDSSRALAENIVALIIVPKIPERDRKSPDRLDDLTNNYEYDTCPLPAFETQKREFNPVNDMRLMNVSALMNPQQRKQLHQLPPILQVTMVAIDEASAIKLQDHSEQPPDWTNGLFTRLSTYNQFLQDLGDPSDPTPDSLIGRISNPDRTHPTPRMNYRVFTTDVVLRGAKWSKEK
jgi:uncharacterized protein (TIGR02599 family)